MKSIKGIPDEQIRQLAADVYAGKVFSTFNIREHDRGLTTMIFMPLAFLDRDENGDLALAVELGQLGMVYEYIDKAGQRGINGYPIFTSCAFLNNTDTKALCGYLKEIEFMMGRFFSTEKRQ